MDSGGPKEARGVILTIAVRVQTLGVGTLFPLIQKCLWECRSHTKICMGRSHAFPLHYTPAYTCPSVPQLGFPLVL